MASFVVLKDAIYSASTKEVVTVGCYFDNNKTELPVISNRKLPMEHLLFESCTQFESVHPTKLVALNLEQSKTNFRSRVLFK